MKNKTTLKRLWNYLGRYKINLVAVIICALLGNLLLIFTPILQGKAIDNIIGEGNVDFDAIKRILIVMLIIYAVSFVFQWLMSILSNVAANKTIHDLRKDAYEKLNKLPLKYFDKTPHGDIVNRMTNDIEAIYDGLFQGITQIMAAMVIIIGSIAFMISISPLITLIVLAITPPSFIIARFIAKHSRKMFAAQSAITGELNGYIEEMIDNQKIVKAYGYEQTSANRFEEINQRLYTCGQKAQWYSSLTNPTTRLINNIGYACVTVVGGIMAVNLRLSVGAIASFLTYSNQFAKPINEITAIASQIQSALASADRIFELLDENQEVEIAADSNIDEDVTSVEFIDTAFSYREDVPLITKLNLKVNKGDIVAIVGPTGSGKTTLVNLLMRFYDVNKGNIMINDKSIYDMSRYELRSRIGMVLQDTWLFEGTIAQNISYGREEASREEIIEAAKQAKAHSFIKRMPNGYDTVIDEGGRNLSQGQKQLLTIARVMLIDPPLLILDEATSSIDTRTEIKIQKAFNAMMQGKTTFIIAHRLSTIKDADTILVLKDGDIIEQGRHEELIVKNGFYTQLYNSQYADEYSTN